MPLLFQSPVSGILSPCFSDSRFTAPLTTETQLRRENLFFERTGDPRFVILIRLLAEKNLVLVFDLSIHDSRLTIHGTSHHRDRRVTQRRSFLCENRQLTQILRYAQNDKPLAFPFTVDRLRL